MSARGELQVEDRAAKKIRELEAELNTSKRQIARILDLVEDQRAQIRAHEASIDRLERLLLEIVTGRTWRTLRAAGEFLKRIVPGQRLVKPGNSVALTRKRSYLVCDEPNATDRSPRSGEITVRGWCLAEGGVDAVKVEIPGLPPLQAPPSTPRPDIKKVYPDLDRTGRAGFTFIIDSLQLPKGRYPITIHAISQGVPVREAVTSVFIDHERGFASDYYRWIHEFERPDDDLIQLKLASIQHRPLISILMAVYNTEPAELSAAIQSVLDQSLDNWQLCIADDSSSHPEVREILESFAREDSRIKIAFQTERGGISKTCNAAWEMATGEYVAFLDHDDTLAPHALAYVCDRLDHSPHADLLYSDEDKIDQNGKRYEPFFKPDWSPDLLLSENYVCHLLVVRQDLARKIGTFYSDCDGSQDYDLILRAAEHATHIEHIPRVLYHWRAGAQSTATSIENKNYALKAAQQALERHADRAGNQMRIEPGPIPGRWRARYSIPTGTRVSIIIPSGGNAEVLRTNLESLFEKATFPNYEVVVIDNSRTTSIEKLARSLDAHKKSLRYIDWRNQPFNYSVINNTAARQCDSPVLLFLNDDTSVITPGWLEAMTELVMRPEVGAVGPKLLYPDGRIQHAGVVMGIFDNCGHAFKGLDGSISHYFDFSDIIRNVSAVTGACLMTKSEIFWKAGGFNETEFAVAFNDIDLCLKIGSLGYRILYTPHAQLYHHEAFSKTSKDLVPHPEEVARMRFHWESLIAADPYYSPNLTRNDENYSLRQRS
ncbi:MAG: glycosyltransferase family 2 protein [Acidobacteriaceae bacterium]|nr:glycosyltransferase family 2 protein [Acidobacteriaceae bacterium]